MLIGPCTARAADQTLFLDVQVNGYSTGKIGEFVLHDGVLLSTRKELDDLGFKVPDTGAHAGGPDSGPGELIKLAGLSGLLIRLDLGTQTLYVTAADNYLLPTRLTLERRASGGPVESSTGATLNYDITGTTIAGNNVASGEFDARLFTPWGVASTDALGFAGDGPDRLHGQSAVRLDSTYVYSDPDSLRRYRLGDFITGGLSWTRPARLGGAQVNSDFTLRPDLITFPLPTISGSAAVPSTVSVLANGNTLFSRQIGAGPFEIPQLPVMTGANDVALTVTNALGRQVTIDLPFYASSTLLAAGLQSYSAQIGLVRNEWGVLSNDYGNLAASGTYRRGLFPMLTVETSAEATVGTVMAGTGIVVNLFDIAVLNAAGSVSQATGDNGIAGLGIGRIGQATSGRNNGRAGTGMQFSAGIQRIGRVFSLATGATVATRNYRDIAAMNGAPPPQLQLTASTGLSLGRFGSIGMAYTGIDLAAIPTPIQIYVPAGSFIPSNATLEGGAVFLQPAQHSHVLSASYSVQFSNVSLYATAFRDFASRSSNGVLVGLALPLGSRTSIGGSLDNGSSGKFGQLQAQQSAPTIGDWGYQAYATGGAPPNHEFSQVQYHSPWALVTGGVDRLGPQITGRAEVQGAVSAVDAGVFPSNAINDSFAIVDTNGLANVRVLDENRMVGRTDSAGRLLVPDLRSYDINHLAIDPADIPADSSINSVTRDVRPQDRSGVVVKFAVQASHGALLSIVDGTGAPIPVGSIATLRANKEIAPVGYDGEAYLENLTAHNQVTVQLPHGQRCSVSFDYHAAVGDIPKIGPLKCQEIRP